jgi:hypothetical protein
MQPARFDLWQFGLLQEWHLTQQAKGLRGVLFLNVACVAAESVCWVKKSSLST